METHVQSKGKMKKTPPICVNERYSPTKNTARAANRFLLTNDGIIEISLPSIAASQSMVCEETSISCDVNHASGTDRFAEIDDDGFAGGNAPHPSHLADCDRAEDLEIIDDVHMDVDER